MWGHQSNFVGHGYHFPAFVPPPPFYFPLADGPLSPEEFARQQALARQQELSRRSSSGLPKEQRSRAGTALFRAAWSDPGCLNGSSHAARHLCTRIRVGHAS
ncbi:hypothetical protein WJX84_009456 [Apatococcus fuscideae]|uniref:Uncharacterized protein n=1 Tax=Apatococcus fuscideae TaxID=2026836 RepID=A0AAW1SXF5_9CHLO